MFDTLFTIVSFVVVLGILIAVHEYGHFIVARLAGVKVLRFSIGFGKPLWTKTGKVDNTEYVIAAVPLGGYVKMLDEREGEVAEAELDRAFNRQPLKKRFAIVAAGPIFNIVFAMFVYWLMFINGVPGIRPVVADAVPDTPAALAQLQDHDEIVAVAGKETPTWQAVIESILPMALLHESVELEVVRDGAQRTVTLPLNQLQEEITGETFSSKVGLKPLQLKIPAVLDQIVEGSVAEKAGLLSGDEIAAIDEQLIGSWEEMVTIIQESPGKPLQFSVIRNGEINTVEVRPAGVENGDKLVGKIGASVYVDPSMFEKYQTIWQFGALAAVPAAIEKSWEMSILTLKMIGKMVAGQASLDNLSGPITIARYAKSSFKAGFSQLLGFIAIISISLGVLNLLPIPILDGGHLFFYLIELVKGSPVSEQVEVIGQQVGLAIIFMMMSLAIYNDIARLMQ